MKKLLPLLLLIAGCGQNEPGVQNLADIEGTWKVTSIQSEDQKEEGKETFEIKKVGETWQASTEKDGKSYDVELRLDTSSRPSVLQLVKEGRVVGQFRTSLQGKTMTWKTDDYTVFLEKVK